MPTLTTSMQTRIQITKIGRIKISTEHQIPRLCQAQAVHQKVHRINLTRLRHEPLQFENAVWQTCTNSRLPLFKLSQTVSQTGRFQGADAVTVRPLTALCCYRKAICQRYLPKTQSIVASDCSLLAKLHRSRCHIAQMRTLEL